MKTIDFTHRMLSWIGVASLLAVVSFAGCGRSQNVADPVDPDVAQRTLRETLDAWVSGAKPDELRRKTPEVVVQDFDWSAGNRLVSYEVKGVGSPQDANLFCEVKLVLEDSSRKRSERLVTYCVGTDPVLTVFRSLGP